MEGRKAGGRSGATSFGRLGCFRKGFSEEFALPASGAACWQPTTPLLEEQVEGSSGFRKAPCRQLLADRPVRLLRKGKACTSACRGGVHVRTEG